MSRKQTKKETSHELIVKFIMTTLEKIFQQKVLANNIHLRSSR